MTFICTVFKNVYMVKLVHVLGSGSASRLGRVWGHDKGKHKQPKTQSLDRFGALLNNFSNEEPRERLILGILFIK